MATDSKDEAKNDSKKRSPMILVIIGVVLVALSAGGYFAYGKFMAKGDGPAADAHGSGKGVAEKPIVQDWETFLVNLADSGGRRYLKINIKLELSGPQAQVEFTNKNVALRDSVIMLLSSKQFSEISDNDGKAGLKQEILTRMNRVLKDNLVKQVYFTDFIVQ